jgi:3-dehydroquinate dehydratase II
MRKFAILVVNGPNLGYLGKRQPEIYGTESMDDLPDMVREVLGQEKANRVELQFFQSNGEGAIIDRLEQAWRDGVDGIILNAGAYTHTSLALADCLAWIGLPCVEVHLSNVLARTEEPLRQVSHIGKRAIGVIAGFGLVSYALAAQALWLHFMNNQNATIKE